MNQYKKIYRAKIILLCSCLLLLLSYLWNQDIYKNMKPLPVFLENEQGLVVYRENVIFEDCNSVCFTIPNIKEYQVWMKVNKGRYCEISSERIEINRNQNKRYKKNINISFLGKNYLTGEQKYQSYVLKGD